MQYAPTPVAFLGGPVVKAPRRQQGTGSIFQLGDRWCAAISMKGRQVRVRRWTREQAEAALRDLIERHQDRLGYYYHPEYPRRPELLHVHSPRSRAGLAIRFSVLERDGFCCRYCGRRPPEIALHVDHVVPVAAGGSDDEMNLVAACSDCNLGKADRVLAAALETRAGTSAG